MNISRILILPLVVLCIVVIGFVIAKSLKTKSSVKVMLLGIGIILAGGIVAVDPDSNLGGFEYLFVLTGLSFVIGGFAKEKD